MQRCAAGSSWLSRSRVWHWWPLRARVPAASSSSLGLAPPEEKGRCHLLHLKPKKWLPVSQLVSMGTRVKRESNLGCWARGEVSGKLWAGWSTQLLRLGGHLSWQSHSHPQNKHSPAGSKEWGPYKHWTPWHVERPFVQSGPLEGERLVSWWYSSVLLLNHMWPKSWAGVCVCPRTYVYFF